MVWDSPPPPPPFPPPLKTLQFGESDHRASTPSLPLSPSILIIASIIAFVIVASASIHLLLRLLSRSSDSSSSSSSPPFIQRLSSSSSASTSTAPSSSSDHDPKILIDSLPLFSLASSVASAPKSSLDCAVCLSPFHPDDQLRLLPACCHAFHSSCIDTWLRSTASCPLCRCSVLLPPPPAPPPPQTAPPPPPALPPPPPPDPSRSGSFRIEIGSVSRRRTPSEEDPPPHVRTYSLGSSFEYLVDEEVEAVLARVRRQEGPKEAEGGGPTPPGAEVAEAAGGGGRNWLKDYVDRLASSASSSFSSLRFSGRWSRRYDGSAGSGAGGESWDLEGNQHLEEEDSALSSFYRWLVGL